MKTKIIFFWIVLTILSFPALAQILSAGSGHSMKICANGTLEATGENGSGQLGVGNYTDITTPVTSNILGPVKAVACGEMHTIALKSDGTVWCWGENSDGQLGQANNTDSKTPIKVNSLSGVIAIAAGLGSCMALKSDGTVWCWGLNLYGQLGNGNNNNSTVPVQVSGLSNVKAIASGFQTGYATKTDGSVWAWGRNINGECGNGNNLSTTSPIQVNGLSNIKTMCAGNRHALALLADNTVKVWGDNNYGQAGQGIVGGNNNTPIAIPALSGVMAIGAAENNTCIVKNDGTLWICGANPYGQLGNGVTGGPDEPDLQKVTSLSGIKGVTGGIGFILALKSDNTVMGIGKNSSGGLGNGTNTDSNIPVLMNGCNVTVGINKISAEKGDIKIYPNPSTGKIHIDFLSKGLNLEVYNMTGQSILKQELGVNEIDMSGFQKGFYMIKIFSDEEVIYKKILIQ